jgi:hypothetical protein
VKKYRCVVCEDTYMVDGNQCRVCPPPEPKPVDMVLYCPACGTQHIDEPEAEPHDIESDLRWTNPPHRSHLCAACGWVWRPADVCTNGVAAIQTRGQRDDDPARITQVLKRLGYVVAKDIPWLYDMENCPIGSKCLLLNHGGVCVLGPLTFGTRKDFMAWSPMPKRNHEEEARRGLAH